MEPIIENLNLKKEKRMILREKEFYKNYTMNDTSNNEVLKISVM